MSRIKDNQEDFINNQVEKKVNETLAGRNIAVSFEHELSNTNYNPNGIKDKSDRLNFYEEFRKKIKNLNSKTWREFGRESKKTGYETIPFTQFAKSLQLSLRNTNIVSPDSKLDVIRVTNQYRVIGKYLAGVYYILAYDVDFSAYKH